MYRFFLTEIRFFCLYVNKLDRIGSESESPLYHIPYGVHGLKYDPSGRAGASQRKVTSRLGCVD